MWQFELLGERSRVWISMLLAQITSEATCPSIQQLQHQLPMLQLSSGSESNGSLGGQIFGVVWGTYGKDRPWICFFNFSYTSVLSVSLYIFIFHLARKDIIVSSNNFYQFTWLPRRGINMEKSTVGPRTGVQKGSNNSS